MSRFGQVFSLLAVFISAGGLWMTIWQYREQVKELNASTIYNVAREGRALVADANTTTGQLINFHFSVYYLQEKGVVDRELQRLLLLDLCELTKRKPEFNRTWEGVSAYYPESFRNSVEAMRSLQECSLDALDGIAGSISVLRGGQ
ncbi:MAG: hypothetical protein BroJett030_28580 [Alphaproteobacteria bacterium]|nr:MAG: hypothetical protein BroJett030_28580 [Alphaproteobacteria bacterium]